MADIKEKIVPPQSGGGKKDIKHTASASDEQESRKLFLIAKQRLLQVNEWHTFAGKGTADFSLTDKQKKELNRPAQQGDYIKIDLPGPGNLEGKGFDWVYIEAIEDNSNPAGSTESIAFRVRPTSDLQEGENVAHFFTDEATSTFIVERNGKEVSAAVFGRNEKPNTETDNVVDKVRNALVGLTAIAGMSNVQWNSLAKGLISKEAD